MKALFVACIYCGALASLTAGVCQRCEDSRSAGREGHVTAGRRMVARERKSSHAPESGPRSL